MKLRTATTLALAGSLIFAAQAQAPALTDPQIVGIVVGANQIDIAYGNLALSKTTNPQIKQFAQQMVTDHTAVLKSVTDLGAKPHVTPADSALATTLTKQAADTTAHLKTLNGAAFDKAYIDNEVAYHTAVIDVVSKQLIPGAKNAELKNALVGAAPLFQGHLQHAKQVQSGLGGGAMTPHAH